MASSDALTSSTTYTAVANVIRARRTHMLVEADQDVPVDVVQELCNLAVWAPNHKKTWPWRFALFTSGGRARLGEAFVADMIDAEFGDDGKRAKTLTKYLRTPAILVAGSSADENPMLHAENRDAVAAGLQNLLLAATAMGLSTFWSTPPLPDSPRVLELCGFEEHVTLVAVVYLGWPRESVDAPDRPPAELHVVNG